MSHGTSLDKADIEKLAELARVRVADTELDEVTRRIGSILDLVDQMQAIDTSDVEPMANPLDATQRLREDTVTEADHRDAYQSQAPEIEDGLYLVPRVVE